MLFVLKEDGGGAVFHLGDLVDHWQRSGLLQLRLALGVRQQRLYVVHEMPAAEVRASGTENQAALAIRP